MEVVGFKLFSLGRSLVGSRRGSQAVFTFVLIPCCLSIYLSPPPLISNVTVLWGWNIPSELCPQKHKVDIDLSLFSLIGSPREEMKGQNLTIFYADRLGKYPHIDEHTHDDRFGAIPIMSELQEHLDKARDDIALYMGNSHIGFGVIDWENWRPLWDRNWRPKHVYRQKYINHIQQQNASLSVAEATKVAKVEFEKAGRAYMEGTLKLGKQLRPNHLWGYYLFPDCYNYVYPGRPYNGSCPYIESGRNDRLDWMWKESTALFPSIYLKTALTNNFTAALYSRGRVRESIRVSQVNEAPGRVPIYVYTRPDFADAPARFLTQDDLVHTIGECISMGVAGIIMWGGTYLTPNKQVCQNLSDYMTNTINPYMINVTLAATMCSQALCQGQGVCVRKDLNSSDYLHLNSERFVIQTGQDGKYTVSGNARREDLKELSEKFDCSCYAGFSCQEKVDIQSIHTIDVCVAEGVCIKTMMKPKHEIYPLCRIKKPPLTCDNSRFAGKHSCVPRAEVIRCLKAICSKKSTYIRAQANCRHAHRKNKSRECLCLEILKNHTAYFSAGSELVKLPMHILYVFIVFKFLII